MAGTEPSRGSTCFVRKLPASFDDERLTQLFSDVGPVRKAFLVRQKGSDAHKGMAFVSFAIAADAQKAVADLQGHKVEGQSIQVCAHARKHASMWYSPSCLLGVSW